MTAVTERTTRPQRVEIRNRMWRGIQTVAVLSGLDDSISAEDLRATLRRLYAEDPAARALCRLDRRSTRWSPVPADELESWLAEVVIDAAGTAPEPAGLMAQRLLRQSLDGRPFVVTVGDGWQTWQVDHVLGDGTHAVRDLVAGLLHASLDGTVPDRLAASGAALPRPLLQASWATLVREPRLATWRTAFDRVTRERGAPAVREHSDGSTVELSLVVRRGAQGSVRQLREWGEVHQPGVSVAVLLMAAARIALEEHGLVAASTDSVVMYDLRRYLPRTAYVGGNFSGALRLTDPRCRDPRGMVDQMRRDVDLGLPLVSLLAASAAESVAPALRLARPAGAPQRTNGPVVLTHLGALTPFKRLPWNQAEQNIVVAAAAPASPSGITITTSEWDKALGAAVTFDASSASAAVIEAAARDIVERPWDLLASTEGDQ